MSQEQFSKIGATTAHIIIWLFMMWIAAISNLHGLAIVWSFITIISIVYTMGVRCE